MKRFWRWLKSQFVTSYPTDEQMESLREPNELAALRRRTELRRREIQRLRQIVSTKRDGR